MTDKQEKLYWRLWNQVCHVNDWHFLKGKVHSDAQRDTSDLHTSVWSGAEERARRSGRVVSVDDLRRVCHITATGKDESHSVLDNGRDVSRVFNLFKLLIEPDDIDARIAWEDPSVEARRRHVAVIKKLAPEAYIDQVCRALFDKEYAPPFWEDLPFKALHQLAITIGNRARDHGGRIPTPAHRSSVT